jgi:hypothetical protein
MTLSSRVMQSFSATLDDPAGASDDGSMQSSSTRASDRWGDSGRTAATMTAPVAGPRTTRA